VEKHALQTRFRIDAGIIFINNTQVTVHPIKMVSSETLDSSGLYPWYKTAQYETVVIAILLFDVKQEGTHRFFRSKKNGNNFEMIVELPTNCCLCHTNQWKDAQ
jgi:hypothetical protein